MLILGLALGGALGFWVGQLHGRRAAESDSIRLSNEISGRDAVVSELRGAVAARDRETGELRAALEQELKSGAEARARLESAREHFAEQRRQIEQLQEKAREAFTALSAAALKSNSEQFVTLAEAKFKPLREQLERYEEHLKNIEEARNKAYGSISQELQSLQQRSDRLSTETGQLVSALRQSGAKGKWGEVTLQRVVELCGLAEHCDFVAQSSLDSGQRPDLVVNLPGGRSLVVDAKVNTSAYLDAAESADEAQREAHLDRFTTTVRATMKALSGKEYWKQLSPAPEFVVMFMPGEAFFSTAISRDRDLLVDGVDKGVLLASPTTLIALLMAVRHGWQQQQVAENAEQIAEAGRKLYENLCTFVSHLDAIRGGLEKAAESYNKAVGSWSSRTEPAARRLKELGAADAGKLLSELPSFETNLRPAPLPQDEIRRAV